MAREKTKQTPIGFTNRHREMIEEIMASKGYPSIASVVQQAVIEMHGNVFKDYVVAKKIRSEVPHASEIKKTNDTDKMKGLCDKLGGKTVEKNGSLYCLYFTYNRKNRYQQEVPLDTLNQSHIDKQYFPSKEEIKVLQNEGKVNYETVGNVGKE
jgi:hypothetical protein